MSREASIMEATPTSNPEAARYAGVRVDAYTVAVYAASGLLPMA